MRAVLFLLCNVLCMTLFSQVRAVRSGNWSDPNTWGGKNPGTSDKVVIPKEFAINYDAALVTISGLDLEGSLTFDAGKSSTLQSSKNIHVKGSLIMKPSAIQHIHTLRFVDVNESRFVGGGMMIMDSDVGLWVSGMGDLDLVGTSKSTGWTNSTDGIIKGQSQLTLKQNASWRVGDEIVITPTESSKLENYQDNFDLNEIKSISGSSITMQSGLLYNHPKVNNTYTPEVLNLTRNVRIEGTANGRAHIMVTSMKVQNVRWVQIRHMGPRKFRDGDNTPDMIPGRYGLHFHHMMNASRGTIVEGVVVRDCGNHSFVPHSSNGITFKNNITYNTYEDAYWYDPKNPTYDLVFDGNIAAKVLYVPRSKAIDINSHPMHSVNAFLLGMGQGNKAVNNVAVGVKTSRVDLGGSYTWEADNEGVWEFVNNVSHNSGTGIRTWQNTHIPHTIDRFASYNNELGIFHGAYMNNYRYVGCKLFEGGIILKASSVGEYAMRFEESDINLNGLHDHGISIIHGSVSGTRPTLFREVTVKNYRKSAVLYDAPVNDKLRLVDFVLCDLGPNEILVPKGMIRNDKIRVQPVNGSSYQVTNAGKTTIQPFAPVKWGKGRGLKLESFSKTDLSSLVHTEREPAVHFNLLTPKLNYRLTDKMNYSLRWSGFVEAQVSEEVIFHLRSAGGHRLWLNDKLIMDSWKDKYNGNFDSKPILLQAGQKYSVKLEYFNINDTRSEATLKWSSRTMPREAIPESQLYYASVIDTEVPEPETDTVPQPTPEPKPDPTPEPDPEPEPEPQPIPTPDNNAAPVANAGPDVTINLPAITVNLIGDNSTDAEDNIVLYEWSMVSGNSQSWIENKAAKNTRIRNLTIGTYVIRLKVTDHKGLTSVDEMKITVKERRTEAEINAELMESMDVKAANQDLSVFPNPAGNTINVQLNNELSGQGFVNIYDVTGKLVKKSQLAKNHSFIQQSIDISSLRPGLFHLEVVIGKDLREVADFIKQ